MTLNSIHIPTHVVDCTGDREVSPSLFLGERAWKHFLTTGKDLDCTVHVLAPGRTSPKHTTYGFHDVVDVLTLAAEREVDEKRHVKAQLRDPATIRVAIESKFAASFRPVLTLPGEGVTVMAYELTSLTHVLCFELAAVRREFDVMALFTTDAIRVLTKDASNSLIEARFGIPMMSPPVAARVFASKSRLRNWLLFKELGAHAPQHHDSAYDVSYPVMVQSVFGTYLDRTMVIRGEIELESVLTDWDEELFIVSATQDDAIDIGVNMVARYGEALAATCMHLAHQANSSLGRQYDTFQINHVQCEGLKEYAPVMDIVKKLASNSRLNGFATMHFRLHPSVNATDITFIPADNTLDALYGNFSEVRPVGAATWQYKVLVHDVNTRFHYTLVSNPLAFIAMVRLYLNV